MTRGFLMSMLKVSVNPGWGGEESGRWRSRVLAVDGVCSPVPGEPSSCLGSQQSDGNGPATALREPI